jgi:hypothetical protein
LIACAFLCFTVGPPLLSVFVFLFHTTGTLFLICWCFLYRKVSIYFLLSWYFVVLSSCVALTPAKCQYVSCWPTAYLLSSENDFEYDMVMVVNVCDI